MVRRSALRFRFSGPAKEVRTDARGLKSRVGPPQGNSASHDFDTGVCERTLRKHFALQSRRRNCSPQPDLLFFKLIFPCALFSGRVFASHKHRNLFAQFLRGLVVSANFLYSFGVLAASAFLRKNNRRKDCAEKCETPGSQKFPVLSKDMSEYQARPESAAHSPRMHLRCQKQVR